MDVGIVKHHIEYCDSCPGRSLPNMLIEQHLFPSSPVAPTIAYHLEVMRSMLNMRIICQISVTAIADWAAAEYDYQV